MTAKCKDKNCTSNKNRNTFKPRIPFWKVGKTQRKKQAREKKLLKAKLDTYAEEKLTRRTEIIMHHSQGKIKCMKCSENTLELLCVKTAIFQGKTLCFNCNKLAHLDILEKKQVKHPKQRENRLKLKLEVLSKYSDKKTPQCICCGVEDIRVLELDHIIPKSNYPIQSLGYNIDTNQLKSLIKKQEHECIVCNKELNINGDKIQCEDEKLHQDDAKLMKKAERQKIRIIKEKQRINSIKNTHHVIQITSNEPKSRSTASLFYFLKKNNFPKGNYQILCKNCNMSKSDKFDCCHKRK